MGWTGAFALGLSLAWDSSVIPKPWVGEAQGEGLDPISRAFDEDYRVEIPGFYWDGYKVARKPSYSFVINTPLLRAKADKFYNRGVRQHPDVAVEEQLHALNGIGYKTKAEGARLWPENY